MCNVAQSMYDTQYKLSRVKCWLECLWNDGFELYAGSINLKSLDLPAYLGS